MTDHERGIEAATKAWMDDRGIDDKFDHWRESIEVAIDAYIEAGGFDAVHKAPSLSALAPQAGDNAEEPEAWIIRCKGWGEELSFTEAGAKELAEKLENIPGVKKATITPLYARPNKGGDGKDGIPAPAEHSVSVEAVGDPEAWLFHETPHRPQTIDPRWMSIAQINKHITALEGELRARAALAPHPCTSTPVVSQNAPDLEDKGGDGDTTSPAPHVMGSDGLDERSFDAARVAYHRTAVGDYGTLRAAISAYLATVQKPASHALKLAEGRLSLLLEAYPDKSDTIDHPSATRYVLEQVRAALSAAPEAK